MIKPFHTIKLNKPVDIYSGKGIVKEFVTILKAKSESKNIVIVTDDNLIDIYGNNIEKFLILHGYDTNIAIIKAGEKSKNINTVSELYKFFHQTSIGRKDMIVALGGGVVGDITGFAAATYMRGIPYIQVPTTLLAMIDSSIGGKTGIDLPFGKNLAGAFYQPEAIVTDRIFLETLPEKTFNDGIAEAVKYGLISDAELFDLLLNGFDEKGLDDIIGRSIRIKSDIVEKDEKESGIRMILNFGHTFGHAIEKCMNYKDITHGAAIAAGMVIASKIGEIKGVTPQGTTEKITAALNKYNLPTSTAIKKSELVKAIGADKKRNGNKINFVLLSEIGKAHTEKISLKELGEIQYE